jgi:hypothetical protein
VKKLGYKLTWRTTCFLRCDSPVWAHTEGNGDYVLFDSLGAPWEIHPCYRDRSAGVLSFELDEELEQLLADLDDVGGPRPFRRPIHTSVAYASEWLGGPFVRRGLVEFYREKRLEHFVRNTPSAELADIESIFGNRKSELAMVDRNGNLFAIFADLHDTVIAPGALVEVEISACRVPIKKLGCVFLCHSLRIVPQSPTDDLI